MAFQLKQWAVMVSGDVNVVGEELGFDWNAVCDAVSDAELYGQDGDGYTTVYRRDPTKWKAGMIKTIFEHVFATHPGVDVIRVMN